MLLNADMAMRRGWGWSVVLAVKGISKLRWLVLPVEGWRRRGRRLECRTECWRGLSRPVAADARWCLYPVYVGLHTAIGLPEWCSCWCGGEVLGCPHGALPVCLGLLCGGVVRCFGICLERFSKCLGLLWGVLGAGCALGHRHGAGRPADRSEVLWEDLDKVGREAADHPPIAAQSARPPRPVAGIETFDQVALYETKISF